jgi:hypothetical protein
VLRRIGIALAIGGAAAALTTVPAQAAKHPSGMDIRAGEAHGFVPVKGAKAASNRRTGDMLWHNGPVMNDSQVTAIYWGTSWATGDVKISQLGQFYTGFSGSKYAATSDEYTGANGTTVGNTVGYHGAIIDNSAAPSHAPSTTTILTEVASKITNPVSDGYYPVYVDTKRGSAGYCAWHSFGTINGTPVQIAFFFNLDGDAGCDPQDSTTGHSQGVAALGNVSAHELSEARTDPDTTGGWFDASGAENGDKCAWTFNVPSVKLGSDSWKLQGEWSNNAFDSRTGYPNNSGQRGCLDGH